MRKLRLVAFGLLATAAMLAVVGGAAAKDHSQSSPVLGQIYVNDNTAGENTVGGFDRHADGTLTPLAGSPFAIGGAGPGHALASQGSIAAERRRPLPARRRRRQQPDLGAADQARRLAPAGRG